MASGLRHKEPKNYRSLLGLRSTGVSRKTPAKPKKLGTVVLNPELSVHVDE